MTTKKNPVPTKHSKISTAEAKVVSREIIRVVTESARRIAKKESSKLRITPAQAVAIKKYNEAITVLNPNLLFSKSPIGAVSFENQMKRNYYSKMMEAANLKFEYVQQRVMLLSITRKKPIDEIIFTVVTEEMFRIKNDIKKIQPIK